MATVVSLEGKRKAPSLEPLLALCADDMVRVDREILARMRSPVALIPELANHLVGAGGKRMRPLLTVAAARLCGYAADDDRHIKLATCVEFIHSATLLHDDVVDVSALRRGKPTANSVWGDKASVLVGDFLFTRSFELMVDVGSLDVLGVLSRASSTIAEGEVLQLVTQRDISTPEATYLEVIKAKTAKLFAAAAEVGAMVAGRNGPERVALESFGMNLGIAFQLVDDALDYAGREAKLGKTVGDDFREGKITLPVILAFLRGGAVDREFWKRTIEKLDQRDGDLAAGADPDRAPQRAGRHARARPPLRRHGARCAGPVPRLAAEVRAARGGRLRHRPRALIAAAWLRKHILAIDQGTTSTRAIVFDSSGRPVASAQKELPQIFPKPGWVEHDPEEIWRATVEVCRGALAKARLEATALAGIGITNQRETTVVWDRATGKPVHNAIVWQDRRTADMCAELKRAGHEKTVVGQDRPAARSLFLGHQDRLDPEERRGRAAPRPRRARWRPARSRASCCGG